jgi:hypothetical protein
VLSIGLRRASGVHAAERSGMTPEQVDKNPNEQPEPYDEHEYRDDFD